MKSLAGMDRDALLQVIQKLQQERRDLLKQINAKEESIDFRQIALNHPDHIIVVNPDFEIVFLNRATEGENITNLLGLPLYNLVPGREDEIKALFERVLESGVPESYETQFQPGSSEKVFYYESIATRRHDAKGLLISSRDISETKMITQDYEQLKQLLNICSYCNRIKSPEGTWVPLENYIESEVDKKISHGVCETCFSREMAKFGK